MDLISRQAAIDACHDYDDGKDAYAYGYVVEERLQDLPSVQSEIIRCKDCKYASPNTVYGCVLGRFSLHDMDVRMYSEDYCSRAERRKE